VDVERRVCEARERGPRRVVSETGIAHSTISAILRRHGCSRAPRPARREVCRYEWPCPGDLLHMDVKRYPRFARPGHAVTGDRRKTTTEVRNPLGHDFFHAVVDDHSRLAYGELLDDERAATTTAFLKRALAWFAGHGIQTRRVMTDGAWSYTRNRSLHELLAAREIHQIVTPPYTPRWNGKVERFHQTRQREWAKGVRYRDHHARNAALAHWLAHYQPIKTPLRDRRPTPDQPRTQPLKAGQLAGTPTARPTLATRRGAAAETCVGREWRRAGRFDAGGPCGSRFTPRRPPGSDCGAS
jgi:hypothetical protein